jgi:peptidoglycan/LPS O-acetylase OafA/YrhL
MVACVLFLFGRTRLSNCAGGALSVVNGLAKISFSVFLVHFPVCLIVNAVFTHFAPAQPYVQSAGMFIAWIASLCAGAVFFRWIETPLGRMLALSAKPVSMPPLTVKVTTLRG